jgi:uncharacterized protein
MAGPFDHGIIFFNDGRFFEAHEAFEEMWRAAPEPQRLFYQGLVQAAVGLHHLGRGNLIGARLQLAKSIAKLDLMASDEGGIDVARLRQELRQVLSRAQDAGLPTVRIVRLQSLPIVVESDGCARSDPDR